MRDAGLLSQWIKALTPVVHQCVKGGNKNLPQEIIQEIAPLTLKNLSGPFTILCIGYLISFIALIFELVQSLAKTYALNML